MFQTVQLKKLDQKHQTDFQSKLYAEIKFIQSINIYYGHRPTNLHKG